MQKFKENKYSFSEHLFVDRQIKDSKIIFLLRIKGVISTIIK